MELKSYSTLDYHWCR